MRDSEALLKRVDELRKAHGYFQWPNPHGRAQLAGWLRYDASCVYCGKNLLETWERLFGFVNTDHLLPKKYHELDGAGDDSNFVPSCSVCNLLKRDYDANRELPGELRYISGPSLTDEQHRSILEHCRREVANRRAKKQRFIEEAISNWKA